MNWIRWLLVIPGAMAGWYLAFAVGISLILLVDSMCPPEQVVSDLCVAPWYQPVTKVLVCFGAALSAGLSLLLAYAIAPLHKAQVVWLTLGVGGSLAVWLGASGGLWLELGCTLSVAFVISLMLHRHTQASRNPVESDVPENANI